MKKQENGNRLHERIGIRGIDGQSYWDLDLDDFIDRCDNTATTFGSEMFRHLLLEHPEGNSKPAAMAKRAQKLREQPAELQQLKKGLAKIGKQARGELVRDIWDGLQYRSRIIDRIRLYAGLNLAQLVFAIMLAPGMIIPSLMIFLAVGVFIHTRTSPFIRNLAASFQYFLRGEIFLRRNRTILSNLFPDMELPRQAELERLSRYSLFFSDSSQHTASADLLVIILDYIRIFFSMEARAYFACRQIVNRHIDQLRKIIICLGQIDCILNTAQLISDFQATPVTWNEHPDLQTDGLDSRITATAMRHPLVADCLPQDVSINRNIIITGMNMSGKSTFLKSLALNQLCAQAFGIAFAESFRTSVLKVISSLKLVDDIENNKSKYYVEAERLLLIQKELGTRPCLCLIDEILTGTNNDERISASIGLLRNFASRTESVIIAATHDTHIAQELSQLYDQFYFDGEIDGERIAFDYRLKPGIVSRRNGLLLLQFLGLEISSSSTIPQRSEKKS